MAGYRSIFLALCALVALAGEALGLASAIGSGPAWDDPLEIKVMNAEIQVGATPGLDYAEAKAAKPRSLARCWSPGHASRKSWSWPQASARACSSRR